MKRQTTPAIVLRRWPYSESSLAVRVLTPTHGTLAMLAKGAYKAKSGMMGVLDTWALVEIEFSSRKGADMQSLYKANLLNRLSGLSKSPEQLAAAGVLGELAELAAPSGQESSASFIFLVKRLESLANGCEIKALMCSALIQALDLLGLSPHLLPESEFNDKLWFDFEAGGVLEPGCQRPLGQATLVSAEVLRLLDLARSQPDLELQAKDETIEEALTILGQFMHFHLERPPRAWKPLRKHLRPITNHEVANN